MTLDWMVLMGVQGWSNVDCVTVWLPATNWNCTISPALALMLSGVYTRELLAVETVTTWTFCAVVEMLDTLQAVGTSRVDQRTRGDASHHGKNCCCELHFDFCFYFCILVEKRGLAKSTSSESWYYRGITERLALLSTVGLA